LAAIADMLSAVFKSAAGHHISRDQSLDSLCTHSQMAGLLVWLEIRTNDYLQWARETRAFDTFNLQHLQEIDDQYFLVFKFVANHLNDEISNSELVSKQDKPSVLFYLAAIFVCNLFLGSLAYKALRNKDNCFGQGLGSLLEALLQYRTRISGRKNNRLEKRFEGRFYFQEQEGWIARFSEGWWDTLFEIGRDIGLKAAEQGIHILSVIFARLNTVIDL
jgi:hypothetical protein